MSSSRTLGGSGAKLLDAREAAEYVGCHANTVYAAAKAGALASRAVGRHVRFTYADLDEWTRRRS